MAISAWRSWSLVCIDSNYYLESLFMPKSRSSPTIQEIEATQWEIFYASDDKQKRVPIWDWDKAQWKTTMPQSVPTNWPGRTVHAPLPPARHNQYGFYACKTKDDVIGDEIYGQVTCWGTIVEHADGVLRAEHMRIETLFTKRRIQTDKSFTGIISDLSNRYEVPVNLQQEFCSYSLPRANHVLRNLACRIGIHDNCPSFHGASLATSYIELKCKHCGHTEYIQLIGGG